MGGDDNLKTGKYLSRDRINLALDKIFEYPLTILSATMGYGKTASVRNYLDKREIRNIWVSLLGSDGEELVFWDKLCSSVERVDPKAGKHLIDMGFPEDARQRSKVMDFIWKLSDGNSCVVVIDDFHLIHQSKPLCTLIEVMAEEEIPYLHIILITRTSPPFNHLNLYSKGLCHYLNTELLAFNQQEIGEYLKLMGFSSSMEEIQLLYHYTNGWISAIYLLLLGLKQGIPVTEISYITRLVEKNLFSTFPDSTKQALFKLSVLDNFTIPQAVQITEDVHIPEIMEQLMEQNAFIGCDRQTGEYQLHHVLLDLLREKYMNGEEKEHVCLNAGKWYFEQEDFVRAIDYYHRAGKMEALLEQMNHIKNMRSGYMGVGLLYKVFLKIPEAWYIKYPFPLLHFAICFAISKDKHMVAEGKRIVDTLTAYYSNDQNFTPINTDLVLGEIEVAKIFLIFNDARLMVEYSKNADRFMNGGVSCNVFRDDSFTFGVPHFLYSYYREAGKLNNTLECLMDGFPPHVFNGCGTGCELVALAEYTLETGELDQVEALINQASYKALTAGQVPIMICADFTKMRYYLATGKVTKAKEVLDQARKYLTSPKYKVNPQNKIIYNAAVDMCEGYLYGCLKQLEMIPEWLRSGDLSLDSLMMRGLAFPLIIYGNAITLEQNWDKLIILCESFRDDYLIFHNQLGLLHNSIYKAIACYQLHGMEAGLLTLLPALQEALSDGIVLPFAEHYEYILPMLYKLRKQNSIDLVYLEKVIRLSEQYRNHIKTLEAMDIVFTEREIQVLQLLSRGMTQREIAKSLCFSISTAKKHLESIYRKLNVNNKINAVQKAQKNKLI